jgi:hypothetical protein
MPTQRTVQQRAFTQEQIEKKLKKTARGELMYDITALSQSVVWNRLTGGATVLSRYKTEVKEKAATAPPSKCTTYTPSQLRTYEPEIEMAYKAGVKIGESVRHGMILLTRTGESDWRIETDEKPTKPIDPRDPDYTRTGIFQTHNCGRCKNGELPCTLGVSPRNCGYLYARND